MKKAKILFARCMLPLGGFILLLLCVAPFLRDLDTLRTLTFEKFVQNSQTTSLESSAYKQERQDSLFSSLLQTDRLEKTAQQIDSSLESMLRSMALIIFDILYRETPQYQDSLQSPQAYSSEVANQNDTSSYESLQQAKEYLLERVTYNYTEISQATYDTLYMVLCAIILATIFGLPLGIALSITKRGRICSHPVLNGILGSFANIVRSFPFIILIILLLPLSRWIVGTSIGATAAIIPLAVAAIPFIARLFEGAFEEVDKGLIEATLSMGASKMRVVLMMIAEAKPGLINAVTITIIGLIGYSAMGGAVGAGGLGDVAIRLGFQSYQEDFLLTTSIVIIILVQFMQSIGDMLVARMRKNR